MSKGSKSRVTDKKRFDENFEAIEWGPDNQSELRLIEEALFLSDFKPGGWQNRVVIHHAAGSENAYLVPDRRPNESVLKWARRCVVIKNIGKAE